MEEVIYFLNAIFPLSGDLEKHLASILKERKVSKKEYLLKAGNVCRSVFFIKKGIFRCFYVRRAKEISSWFMKEGDLIISVESFFQQKESKESIQALEDAVLFGIEYGELQQLYRTYIESNFIGRVLTEKYYTLSEQRVSSLRMQFAPDRYKFIMSNFPELIQRAPSKYIASYLGITEETLSRIRAKRL
jgi:CRP-like cAMP-binding protein